MRQTASGWWLTAVIGCALVGCGDNQSASPPSSSGAGKSSPQSTGGNVPVADLTALSGTVKIDGSSTVYLISEAVAEDFQQETKAKVKVTVGILGTSGGFQKFNRGEIDIADASRPILQKEIDEAKKNGIEYIELPIAVDALTVIVNHDNKLDSIKVSELKTMWGPEAEGKVNKWSDVNKDWPNAQLSLYGPGTSSGTFDYFTEAVMGKKGLSRSDFGANEDDQVIVKQVAGNKNALAYLGFAYYEASKKTLKALAIDDGNGPVLPSAASVKDGTYYLARPLFLYVNRKSADRPEVKAFVEYYLSRAAQYVSEVKYIPLPEYTVVVDRFKKLQTGTALGGEQKRMSAEELLKLEVK